MIQFKTHCAVALDNHQEIQCFVNYHVNPVNMNAIVELYPLRFPRAVNREQQLVHELLVQNIANPNRVLSSNCERIELLFHATMDF